MPNRYLRESYIESERVNSLSWIGEAFWTRLLVKVDDFGRIEAHPKILRAKLFPLKLEQVREADVSRLLHDCEQAGLLRLYVVDGKAYLQMAKWEQGRAITSKCPDPPPASTCLQTQTSANICTQPHTDAPDSDTDTDNDPDNDPDTRRRGRSALEFDIFWQAYPKKRAKADAEKAWKKVGVDITVILNAIALQRKSPDWLKDGGQYIPLPASWLNARRWEDEMIPIDSAPRIPGTAGVPFL